MRRLALILALLFCFVGQGDAATTICGGRPAAGGAAGSDPIALVSGQTAHATATGTGLSVSLPSSTTAGNFLVLLIMISSAETITVDPAMTGETWTLVGSQSTGSKLIFMYYAKNLVGGQTTATATRSGTGGTAHIDIAEFANVNTGTAYQAGSFTSASGNSNAPSVTSPAPSSANALAISYVRIDVASTLTVPAGYTSLIDASPSASAYKLISAASVAAWGSTGSGTWADIVAIFLP